MIVAIAVALAGGFMGAEAQQIAGGTFEAEIALTTADTAGVVLVTPNSTQTIVIRNIYMFWDNAANNNIAAAGIVASTAAQTRYLWVGEAMASSGIKTASWLELNKYISPTVAQAGLRLFITGASSDTLWAKVEYQIVPK